DPAPGLRRRRDRQDLAPLADLLRGRVPAPALLGLRARIPRPRARTRALRGRRGDLALARPARPAGPLGRRAARAHRRDWRCCSVPPRAWTRRPRGPDLAPRPLGERRLGPSCERFEPGRAPSW